MRERSILILYATSYGQTAKIARRLAEHLREWGAFVTLVDTDEIPGNLRIDDYDGVMIGGSVLFGGHKRALRRYVARHRDALAARPTAFFSVSGSAASARPEERAQAQAMIDGFIQRTGWQPTLRVSFAGAIAYRQYNPFVRLVLQHLMRQEGPPAPTDTSRDHELTDWHVVRRFADTFIALLSDQRVPATLG